MKVAIITITDGANYGNRLQNFALQQILTRQGIECETIKRLTSRDPSFLRQIGAKCKDVLRIILGKKTNHVYRVRQKRFKKYNSQHIIWSKYTLHNNTSPKDLSDQYDFFICGSDQIWNTKFDVISEDILNYLASFAPSQKRIAYAASFGTASLDEHYLPYFRQELPSFKAISVREKAGVEIIKNTVHREAQLVLDPTMLLTAEEWEAASQKPSFIETDDRYIVTYFMSGRTETINNHINRLKDELNCQYVINLNMEFCNRNSVENKQVFCTTPDEFVWLIRHSVSVLTDSYHATVFSLLFHKPFCVYDRLAAETGNKMGSRIDTLLGYFGMEAYMDDITSPHITPQKYNGVSVDQILECKRKTSITFLRDALGLTKEEKV